MHTRLFLVLFFCATFTLTAPSAEPLAPEKAKVAFLKLLDRPKVPADVKEGPGIGSGRIAVSRWSFASEKKADGTVERVPVLMVAPAGAKGKLPVIVSYHGGPAGVSAVRWSAQVRFYTSLGYLPSDVAVFQRELG